jgi:ABC-type lipoprotein export system ATPase subunit
MILADEPTGNMDVRNGEWVLGLLSDLGHQDNYTVIIVTHDVSIVKNVVVVFQMSDGRISAPSTDKRIGLSHYQQPPPWTKTHTRTPVFTMKRTLPWLKPRNNSLKA